LEQLFLQLVDCSLHSLLSLFEDFDLFAIGDIRFDFFDYLGVSVLDDFFVVALEDLDLLGVDACGFLASGELVLEDVVDEAHVVVEHGF